MFISRFGITSRILSVGTETRLMTRISVLAEVVASKNMLEKKW
jgi:hypothetical protein